MFLFPYNNASASAKELGKAMKTILPEFRIIRNSPESTFRGGRDKVIINWGASEVTPEVAKSGKIFNHPEAVKMFVDKLQAFKFFKANDIPHPEWTESAEEAGDWILAGGYKVFARTSLRGNSGQGIVVMTKDNYDQWPKGCKLFVRYVPKKHEFRVHFVGNKITDFQRKALRAGHENPNWEIRNHSNGFVFARENVELPEVVREAALKFINTGALDFGAIDIIFNEKANKAYLLEVNTAPGLEGTTLERYKVAFKEYLKL